jgi:cytochrome c biogenesis protein CcdA
MGRQHSRPSSCPSANCGSAPAITDPAGWPPQGAGSAVAVFPLGIAFALNGTPFTWPALAAVLAVASVGGTVNCGVILLAFYSAGLGVPFLLFTLRAMPARVLLSWLRRRGRVIELCGGLLLTVTGIVVATGVGNGLLAPHGLWLPCPGWLPV